MNKMKRLLVVLALLILSSCVEPIKEPETIKEEAPRYVYKFTFDGHKYIQFSKYSSGGYDSESGYVHDPECLEKDIREILTEQNNKE